MPFRHSHSYSPVMPFSRLPTSSITYSCQPLQPCPPKQQRPVQRKLREDCGSANALALPGLLSPSSPLLFSSHSAHGWTQSSYGSLGGCSLPPPAPLSAGCTELMAGCPTFPSDIRLLAAATLVPASSFALPPPLPVLNRSRGVTPSSSHNRGDSGRLQPVAASVSPFSHVAGLGAAPHPSPMSSSSSLSSVSGSSTPSTPTGGSSVMSASSSSSSWLPSPQSERQQQQPPASQADSEAGSQSDVWQCAFGCGQSYSRTSGRSIRRHLHSCFRARRVGGASLTDRQVDAAIAAAQDSGQLDTGFKRWQKRRRRRLAEQLNPEARWDCASCGKMYRRTSSKSIRLHAQTCSGRRADQDDSSSSDSKLAPQQQQTADAARQMGFVMHELQPEQLNSQQPALSLASLRPFLSSGSSSSLSSSAWSLPPPSGGPAAADSGVLDNIVRLYNQQLQLTSELQRCVQSMVHRPQGDTASGAGGAAGNSSR